MQFDKTQPLYIIGDVHGCYKTLCALIEKLPKKWDSQIIFVGDLIDRGAESCAVIDLVIKNNYACILGNHEDLMLEYYHANPPNPMRSASVWICNGGNETMQSYQNNGGYQKIHEHLDYLSTLPRFLEIDYPDENGLRLFVTHGFGLPLYRERNERGDELIWNRLRKYNIYKEAAKYYGIFNVFGHDVQENVLIMDNFAAIDTGCVYYGRKENARLSALEWPSKRIFEAAYCG